MAVAAQRGSPTLGVSSGRSNEEMAAEPPVLEDMGPIDYVVLEWGREGPGFTGEVAPLLLDLVDRGTIRILDIAFLAKDESGDFASVELGDLGDRMAGFDEFE